MFLNVILRFEIYIFNLVYRDELKKRKRRKLLVKIVFVTFIKATALIAMVYFLFFTSYLRITNLNIKSNNNDQNLTDALKTSVRNWLNESRFGLKWRSNIFFVSSEDMRDFLYGRFPQIANLKITKNFPHELNIYATEREHYGTLCLMSFDLNSEPKCYQFDSSGKAYKTTALSIGFIVFTVFDYRHRQVELGQQVIEENWLLPIISARHGLEKNNIKFGEFIIPENSFDEFYVKMPTGTNIFFSFSTEVSKQIEALAHFLSDREKNAPPLEYIDLRIQDRIYFK